MTQAKAEAILAANQARVRVLTAKGGYGCAADVLGGYDERIRVRVTHANPGSPLRVGDELAVPVERIGTWKSR